ncbi:MucR family transcriptional regulator [Desulfoplanes formicivorans]|uniref:Transcriptional regulator n=1 Tax=Desulfoplanes formicivorans TaxID=1592317 RepID=A0A194AGH2_9BACT|nr:MucR family transcriptional regulator [Desulfoplanes formicivorans]GAU09172.1 transcriptional regulator [Desulfoplanes formicivorans]
MEDYLKEALEIVKAQASVRTMTEEEITSMVQSLSKGIRNIAEDNAEVATNVEPPVDPKKAIREKSVICLECGKSFKVLTKKHLASHGLTPEEYRAKWGYKKGTSLVAKALARERRKKMKDMKLWEKRRTHSS